MVREDIYILLTIYYMPEPAGSEETRVKIA